MVKVLLRNNMIITGLTEEQEEKIKEDLTFPNPDYEKAVRYSRFAVRNIPKSLYYYEEGRNSLLVPRGYKIPFEYEIEKDERFLTKVKYPKLKIELRETQKEAVQFFEEKLLNEKSENGVIVLPTGKGKSILGLYLARRYSQRVLIVVQKDDLINGWTADAEVIFGMRPKDVGLIKAKEFRIGEQVTLTTIQTLSKLPHGKIRELHKEFGMIIVDEFHRSVAKIYETVHSFPARFKIGLTATPLRNDGLQDVLYLYFGGQAYAYVDNADDEDILPVNVKIKNSPTIFQPEIQFDNLGKPVIPHVSHIRSEVANSKSYARLLTRDIFQEFREGKSIVVFSHSHEHCENIYNQLLDDYGEYITEDDVQLYYGKMRESKSEALKKAESKETLITIATYAIATEGTNVKSWERGFLASSVANEKDTIQAIGRCRRTKEGKEDCIIYDYRFPKVMSLSNHGKVRDRVYSKYGYNVIESPTKARTWGREVNLARNIRRK